MPRQLRLEYAGAIYHIMSRGDRREAIFRDEQDRKRFLATLEEACGKTGWEVHAWCLMGQEEWKRLGWSERELRRRRKGVAEKIRIARRIRSETTMSLKWIAASLVMGTWTSVANCLCQS